VRLAIIFAIVFPIAFTVALRLVKRGRADKPLGK
jgi:hypothetical protein